MDQPRHKTIEEINREATLDRLIQLGGNRTKTAASLGISIRTLRNWLYRWRREGYAIIMPKYPAQGLNMMSPVDKVLRGPKLPEFGADVAKKLVKLEEDGVLSKSPVPQKETREESKITLYSGEVPCLEKMQTSQQPKLPHEESSPLDVQSSKASHWESDETQIPNLER